MSTSKGKASTRAKNKYNAKAYDSIHLTVPKGRKPEILAVAEAAGDSLNGYITKALNQRLSEKERYKTKIYTIIGGVNGTGKSSFTGALKPRMTDLGEIIDVDKLTAEAGVSPIEGGKIALHKITDCLAKGESFTQETTLSGHRTVITAKKAKALGFYIRMYYIGLDTPEESLARIANRVARGGHKISEDDVRRRFENRFDAIKKILHLCNEVIFFDNDNGFEEAAKFCNGKLILTTEKPPKWVNELSQSIQEKETDSLS